MFDKMVLRKPSDTTAFSNLQGHQVTDVQNEEKAVWWQTTDLPSYVMQSSAGTDVGNGCFEVFGLAREAALLHVTALVIVHFFSGFRIWRLARSY